MLSELRSLILKLCSKQYNKNLFCTLLWLHSYAVVGNINIQPKQGKQDGPMSKLRILLCLWVERNKILTYDYIITHIMSVSTQPCSPLLLICINITISMEDVE